LNELHNHSTFRQFYDEFHSIFLHSFVDNRRKNVTVRESIYNAKKDVKKRLSSEMQTSQEHKKFIICAYNKVCYDSKIVEKALNYYKRMEIIK
jgi:hypothetical protein